jgi:hypothetical protein
MNLVDRVTNILLQPKQEWQVIATETSSAADLYRNYIIPLSAIPPVAGFIGFSLVGAGGFRVPVGEGFGFMILRFVLGLIGVYIVAHIIDYLAPRFGGEKNFPQALKATAYSMTAAWIAGIFSLIPVLGILGILGLYSLYLLYVGLPVLMKSAPDKALVYTGVVVIAGIIVYVIIRSISMALFLTHMPA